MSKDEIEDYLAAIISEELGIEMSSIDTKSSFHELGLDSINSMFLLEKVENKYQLSLSPLYFWDYPSIETFSELIAAKIK